jgi:hypothetical protein
VRPACHGLESEATLYLCEQSLRRYQKDLGMKIAGLSVRQLPKLTPDPQVLAHVGKYPSIVRKTINGKL